MKFLPLVVICCISLTIAKSPSIKDLAKEVKKLTKELKNAKKDIKDTEKDMKKKADKNDLDGLADSFEEGLEDLEDDIEDLEDLHKEDNVATNARINQTMINLQLTQLQVERNQNGINDIQDAMDVLHSNCPSVYPHAFYGGSLCCKTGYTCNGTEIDRCSTCCLVDDFIKCPEGIDCYDYGTIRPSTCCKAVAFEFGFNDTWNDFFIKNDQIVNSYPYWVSQSGYFAVWHFSINETWFGWMEGSVNDVGSDNGWGWAPSNSTCIEDIDVSWYYLTLSGQWIPDDNYLNLTCYHSYSKMESNANCNLVRDTCDINLGRSGNSPMRVNRRQIQWSGNECKVPQAEIIKMKRSARGPGPGYPPFLDTNFFDIAHVYPCASIRSNVQIAINDWSFFQKVNLKVFALWLFKIDDEAVIKEVFLTGNPSIVITFRDYLNRGGNGDGYTGSVKNTNEENRDLAIAHIDRQKWSVVPNDAWAINLVTLLTQAPANLRYGREPTNNFIGCNLDPVGRGSGFPTVKECQAMIWDGVMDQPANLKTTYKTIADDSFSSKSLPSGQYFTSTGSAIIGIQGKNYGVNENGNYPNPADPSFTHKRWKACFDTLALWNFVQ